MSRSRVFFILIVFFLPVPSFSQYFTIDTIKGQSPYNNDVSYIFPHLASHTDQTAAQRINDFLVQDLLQINAGEGYESIFERVWGDTDRTMPAIADISYNVINNDSNFFCISISGQGCGAYCEGFTQYYTLDSKSGAQISLEQLLSKEGLENISEQVRIKSNKRIYDAIAKYQNVLKKGKFAKGDSPEYYRMAIDVYGGCIDSSRTNYNDASFTLDHSILVIYKSECLPHVVRSLDEVDYTFPFQLMEIRKYLSAYGKSLLKL